MRADIRIKNLSPGDIIIIKDEYFEEMSIYHKNFYWNKDGRPYLIVMKKDELNLILAAPLISSIERIKLQANSNQTNTNNCRLVYATKRWSIVSMKDITPVKGSYVREKFRSKSELAFETEEDLEILSDIIFKSMRILNLKLKKNKAANVDIQKVARAQIGCNIDTNSFIEE